jgi:hypothetical protein
MASLQNDDATLSRSQAIAIAMFVIVAAFTATGFFLTSLQTTERSPQSSLVELSLSDVQALLPSEARTLAESSRTSLDLLALPALTADVAKELAEFPGILNLSGLRSLSTKSAKQLSQLPPSASLVLDGLASLPPDTARALAQSRCRYISLNSLKDLTPDLVEALSAYGECASLGCMLHLDGVSSISPATADKVRTLKADGLWMDGLENLGQKEAEALAKFRGAVLSLGGLKVTSPAVIEALSEAQRNASSAGERALALAYGSTQILQQIGVWQGAEKKAAPIRHIHVSDRGHFGKLRLSAEPRSTTLPTTRERVKAYS